VLYLAPSAFSLGLNGFEAGAALVLVLASIGMLVPDVASANIAALPIKNALEKRIKTLLKQGE
jgi:hypothetical protein